MPSNTPAEANTFTRLLIGDREAAALAGVSRAHWHRLRSRGALPPSIRLGRAVRWRRADVLLWIEWGCCDGREFAARMAAAGRRTARIVG